MLIIRKSQMVSLAKVGFRYTIESITAHVKEIWVNECQHLGDEAARNTVEKSINKALNYGFQNEYEVARYVDLVFALEDLNFDSLSWAEDILNDQSVSPRSRMDRLWEAAKRYLQEKKE